MNARISQKALTSDIALLIYIALFTTVCHLLIGGNYGYFLDELYTLACSRHLSLAFVDIPPVAPSLLALVTMVFGDSLFAIHILPSLFSGGAVIITGLMAKELGAGKWAAALAGLAAAFVPVWMAVGSLFTYDFLDQFVILLLFYYLIKLLKTENLKLWLTIGAIAGIGLMTKPSMVFFIMAVALALLLTKHRRMYATRWLWLGVGIAFVIILPALVWQIQNGFPIVEYWGAYALGKTVRVGATEFVLMQIVGMNVFLLPLWLTGLCFLLFDREGRKYRLLGVVYLILFAVFLVTGAKMYMLIPAYAMLLAGGVILFERFASRTSMRKALVIAYVCLIMLTGVIQAPNFMPILPIDKLVAYYDTIGGLFGAKSIKLDSRTKVELPQYFYDRLEWETLIDDVAEVYKSIPASELADTAIVTQNYGWAGAIDLFGGRQGLPNATCGQLNYYFFSLDNLGRKTWIMIGETKETMQEVFDSVTFAKVSQTTYRQPEEIPILICREPKFTVEEARLGIKKFQ